MSKTTLTWILGILTALFIAGVTVIILGGATEEVPPVAQTSASSAGDLRLSSQMATAWVVQGERTEFWLQVENTGKASVTNLTLLPLDAPGFSVEGCDCQAPGAACPASATGAAIATGASSAAAAAGTSAPCGLLVSSLAPGQKITVWIHLRAEIAHPSEILSTGVSWKDAAANLSSMATPAGPVSIRTGLDEWIQARVALLQGLALPLTIFLLGGIFSVAKYFSDRSDKVADEGRERLAQIADEKREQLTQTWTQMLPASHKLALGYYIPMSAAVHETLSWLSQVQPSNPPADPAAPNPAPAASPNQRASDAAPAATATPPVASGAPASAAASPKEKEKEKENEEKLKRGFFALMLFEARVRKTTLCVGGFYFKNRIGEKIVSRCYLRYRQLFYRQDPEDQKLMEQVRDHVTANMDWNDFNVAWTANQAIFDKWWEKFQAWTAKPDGYPVAVHFLSAFRAVLEYEVNRPYEYWYGEMQPLQIDPKAEEAIRGDWPEITDPAERAVFRASVAAYLNANKKKVEAIEAIETGKK